MKSPLTIIITLLLIGYVQAEGFRLEIAYFDPVGGPLTMNESSSVPLPDGCRAQILMDTGDKGILPPSDAGDPAAGNAFYSGGTKSRYNTQRSSFAVNGVERLRTAGFFLSDPVVSGDDVPDQPLFIRVWNAADPAQATGYWDSPLYKVLPGFQQISFLRDEWTYHGKSGYEKNHLVEMTASAAGTALAGQYELLAAHPNPFNAVTRITFSVKEAGRVRLRVFDLEGRLSAMLVNDVLTAGLQSIDFDGSALSTGLYFLSLEQAGAAPQVRKIVLIR
jgi:hypothetical protein